ncbi:MAG: transcription-repair coupling factor [Desulfobacterales bacterium]
MTQNQAKMSVRELIERLPDRRAGIDCTGLTGAGTAYLVSRLRAELGLPVFIVTGSQKATESLAEDLQFFLPPSAAPVSVFPAYAISPFKFMAYHNETAARRIESLYRLVDRAAPPLVITSIDALLQKVIPRRELIDYAELIMAGEGCDRDRLVEKLVAGGYNRTAIVEEPGDFCVRGMILDVFSPGYPEPLRIEFFGDTVETIRLFSAATQRKLSDLSEAVILPAREAILPAESRMAVIARIRQEAARLDLPVTRVRKIVDRIKTEGVFPGAEGLLPLIFPELSTLFDYAPDGALFVLADAEDIERQALGTLERARTNTLEAENSGRLCVEPERMFLSWEEAQRMLNQRKPLRLRMFAVPGPDGQVAEPRPVGVFEITDTSDVQAALRHSPEKERLFLPLVDWINAQRQTGSRTLLVCRSRSRAERLQSILVPYGLKPELAESPAETTGGRGRVFAVLGRVSGGFAWPDEQLAVIAEEEILGSRRRRRSSTKRPSAAELVNVEDLKMGDLIVHTEHGIGRYGGLVKLKLDGTTNDFLLMAYRDEDKLYLPVDRMNMVQKYLGVDGVAPVLDKMGGRSWARVKARVKKSAEKMAGELLKLYAARRVSKGVAFERFEDELREFEAGFTFEETADQLKAINDVLEDMADPVPMDRLICGDVGYGKTEVALRASFVAVYNGKQVAVLVPTTVLAEQHFATFTDRFGPFPVRIAGLSRFRSPREQREILQDLKAGKIDIVIGTHRLLSKDVAFKDLGLLVLDEEQRFGVKHKEKLKALRRNVDVLTLTATPIPRTLHMSLLGTRDISLISTPPEYRQAIMTYISAFDDVVVTEAIRKELQRNGQIFFIHNNIASIEKVAKKIKSLVPEVRLDVAHGRLSEEDLERIMLRFFSREIDMLVCTTIVESGLDIPAANTILVNRADKFGLAQMYQLRGRVGRSEDQAYAYLFIPDESLLGKDAQKRLKVLMEHSDLGAGFQIAMSDLQIRGGGTILGASQSGHIAAVGYEMFLELMENAVAEMKGEPVQEPLSPEINIQLSAFIPESYIPDIDQRLSAYRRLSRLTEVAEISDFKTELADRYGPPPEEVLNLLLKIMLRVFAIKAGVKRLDLVGPGLTLVFSEAHQNDPRGLAEMVVSAPDTCSLTPDCVLKTRLRGREKKAWLGQAKNILKEVARHVKNNV